MSLIANAKLTRGPSDSREQAAERYELPEVVIGKDVLELVSSGMYVDPMTIYREYIQNAADAVDAARASGVLAPHDPGRVNVSVDSESRTVKIRDNGCGIPFPQFAQKLTALGGSAKRGTLARGFRGVGRLAGLGYAQELIFRARVAGETKVSQLSWDCRLLKSALREAGNDRGVAELIRSATRLERVEIDDAPARFFEVEMRGIVRLQNDRLMSPSSISEYLSQVAPVPFSPAFALGAELTELLSRHVDLGSLDIRINDAEEPVTRPHRDNFSLGDKHSVNFDGMSVVEVPGIDGNVAAVAWILHHEYDGALSTGALVRGLRLRTGNVQVGDHALLEDLFPEARFNAWSVGEVHVIDRRIVPNGRRDHFEQNAHFNNLVNHLAPTARDIARRCRTSSVRRRWQREFELHAQSVAQTLGVITQGSVSRPERERLALSAEQTLLQMSKVAGKELLADSAGERIDRIDVLRAQLAVAMNDDVTISSPLMRLPEAQRRTYENFFELVYECSTNRVAAKALIDRMLMRLG
ncbi:MAG: molecular chaperone Hsp90 [Mesorhizobium sp.]|uniref:ATP-binding protein n=1 Tax=Mesorhizobium sp. TaxID=1871066 RepID=UPI000FE66F42|nr:ATP-binding protein [Mesorhizobium sp.]RWP83810.1 MAG: molecular chaperone Hsp90 [Mesorhizobium sp.]